ncbi:MAG: helix-turn-helix domain-containing protein [Alicyclobacillus sp.]|nr:helix-turn-helix domain-containing protein [Alicyclobacillus sp.]
MTGWEPSPVQSRSAVHGAGLTGVGVLPWQQLQMARTRLGLSRSDLARGIVGASAISHIEAGRAIPSETVLEQLGQRLQVDVAKWKADWAPWRRRAQVRKTLARATSAGDWANVASTLADAWGVLTRFERHLYGALLHAARGDTSSASGSLQAAWFAEDAPRPEVTWPGTAAEVRALERAEALCLAEIARQSGRTHAAAYWDTRARRRGCYTEANEISGPGGRGATMSMTGEELGYQDAMRQVERALRRRAKALEEMEADASEEQLALLQARKAEVEHLIGVVQSLHR